MSQAGPQACADEAHSMDMSECGYCDVALVQQSGESRDGISALTLQMMGVVTRWCERVAMLGKWQVAMEAGFR